jgi:nucleoside-diphosphate-sugar epimerase
VLAGELKPEAVDWVIHLEVRQHVLRPRTEDVVEFERVNVAGTAAWLEWCRRHGVNGFVGFSSIKAVVANQTGATDESASGQSAAAYGASKWRAEGWVREWAGSSPARRALILRPAVIYGPGSTANIAAMFDAIRRRRFFLIGRNDNLKSVAAIRNVVAAVVYLLSRVAAGKCETFNLADAERVSVRQLDGLLRGLLGMPGNSPSLPRPLARLAAWAGDLVFRGTGRTFPVNSSRYAALLETSLFPADKLVATGFRHPLTILDGLRELVEAAVTKTSV